MQNHAPLITLTYDDGAKDHFTTIAPILEKYGLRGTFNIVTDWISNSEDDYFMSWANVRNLLERGHAVEAHSCTHANLVELLKQKGEEAVRHEIHNSKVAIETHTGIAPALFCHPYIATNDIIDSIILTENLRPMTLCRYNFGHYDHNGTFYDGAWRTTAEFLNLLNQSAIPCADILCHGAQIGTGWEPFNTPDNFEQHIRTIKSYQTLGKIQILLSRDL